MENSNLLVGLDIGTTSIKAVVADNGRVIGAVATPNTGMRHGHIVDIDETAASIKRALTDISEKTGTTIHRVVTGLPVGMLQLEPAAGLTTIDENGREVNNNDVKRVLQAAIKSAIKDGREPISYLPSRFIIDGKTNVDDPRKMIAHSLAVNGILLTAPSGDLHNLNKAIERANYYNNFFVPTPLAIASVALDEGERTFGAIILDFGGGVTSATVIHQGQIKYAKVDLEGGSDITNDISVVLSTSKKEAEQIKIDYGYADPRLASEQAKFAVRSVGATQQQMIDEKYLSEIINARVNQIINRIGGGLVKHDTLKLPGGIIITGGTSLLQGIDSLVSQKLNVKTKLYQPDQLGIRNPAYTAGYGIVKYAYNMSEIDYLVENVIYGSQAVPDLPESKPKKERNAKRQPTPSETIVKEDYNVSNTPRSDESSEAEQTNKKEKKEPGSFTSFFKKFFD
ncbi:cell division protein FtsA [Lactobacillus corticis]|uniref:Cell division protein FtsA n=1 Tax=Lactobacillus corticis TaxID=2201249 RepID=A0A916VJD5_9LACO|nr:cell division protein FtsA [Lactobacillus corticis]GFZ27734.1 cell division protein FtsA [Lactobacillus corticis]